MATYTVEDRRSHVAGLGLVSAAHNPQQYADDVAARRQQRIAFLQAKISETNVVLENLQDELAVLQAQ